MERQHIIEAGFQDFFEIFINILTIAKFIPTCVDYGIQTYFLSFTILKHFKSFKIFVTDV